MEKNKIYYSNNKLKEEGFIDENGKQNKWIYYYESGELHKEIEFVDNIKSGLFIRYFKNGNIAFKSNYLNGKLDGFGQEFYETGNLKEEWNYTNDVFVPINFWDGNGYQTLKNGTGYKIAEYGYSNWDVYKQYFENGSLIKEEKIKSANIIGFVPKEGENNID